LLAASQGPAAGGGRLQQGHLLRNMQEISARNIRIMSTVLTLFASVIAVGVVYNNARIALAERTWELASLRVLGFTRAEVSALLLGEMAIWHRAGAAAGHAAGRGLVHLIAGCSRVRPVLQFPVVIQPRAPMPGRASAWWRPGVASALVVRRRIDRLDMVAALKTRIGCCQQGEQCKQQGYGNAKENVDALGVGALVPLGALLAWSFAPKAIAGRGDCAW
jgi:putative ABC transport system permease protein